MTNTTDNHLLLFRNDLRLADNPALAAAAGSDRLLCVFCWPTTPAWCNLTGLGEQRDRFLRETLRQLHRQLQSLGQGLLVLHTDPRVAIPQLVTLFDINRISTAAAPGDYEARQLRELEESLPVPLDVHDSNSLFTAEQMPLEKFPKQFTPFRRQVEELPLRELLPSPSRLPPPPAGADFPDVPASDVSPHPAFPVRGGSAEGHRRLQRWMFQHRHVAEYKQTRNYLDGLDGSSVLSPWLAHRSSGP